MAAFQLRNMMDSKPILLHLPNTTTYFVSKDETQVYVSFLVKQNNLFYEIILNDEFLNQYKEDNGLWEMEMNEFLADFLLALPKPSFSEKDGVKIVSFKHKEGYYGPQQSVESSTVTEPLANLLHRISHVYATPIVTEDSTTSASTTSQLSSSASSSLNTSSETNGGTKRASSNAGNVKNIVPRKLKRQKKKKQHKGQPRLQIVRKSVK
jgi:hypothetical protein